MRVTVPYRTEIYWEPERNVAALAPALHHLRRRLAICTDVRLELFPLPDLCHRALRERLIGRLRKALEATRPAGQSLYKQESCTLSSARHGSVSVSLKLQSSRPLCVGTAFRGEMAQRMSSKLAQKLLKGSSVGKKTGSRPLQNGSSESALSNSNLKGPSDVVVARAVEAGKAGRWHSVEPVNGFQSQVTSKGLFGRDLFPSIASTSGRGFASSAWPELPTPQSMAPKYIKKGLTWVRIWSCFISCSIDRGRGGNRDLDASRPLESLCVIRV